MRITIVTPVKDEIENLPYLFDSISKLDSEVYHWIILENDSTDGSLDYLKNVNTPSNVNKITLFNLKTDTPEYKLGFKYSRIVKQGLDYALEMASEDNIQLIGILDADCRPAPDYYSKISNVFEGNPTLGIASGVLVDEQGKEHSRKRGFPRGSCRLWRVECLVEAGYLIGMSADALSAIKAELRGWRCDTVDDATVTAREVGQRAGQSYYGRSAYFRGETLFFTFLKSISKARKSPVGAWEYMIGYLHALWVKDPKIEDDEILKYSKNKIYRILGINNLR